MELIVGEHPESVLDYSCGDGRLVEKLAGSGTPATGYDPDPDCIARCLEKPGPSTFGGKELLKTFIDENARCDTVVCGRVLCTIDESSEFRNALQDLRCLVSDPGRVLMSVCNPFHSPRPHRR